MTEHFFPLHNDTSRKIIHIDMDAFFASVEMRDNPALKDQAVVIAKHPRLTGGRGVVSTCNYKAREYGIHSAMSAQRAYELCPKAVFVHGNYEKYTEISKQIREIFHRYTDLVEPMSVDEAYLDVTENKLNCTSAIKIARMIQKDIYEELHLTCSAGISYNKFLAKIASDVEKPHGLTVITPEDAEEFLKQLPIEKFYGVGKKSAKRLKEMGIQTGADLLEKDELTLIKDFGKMGYSLFRKVRGIHNAKVIATRERKSIGKERTFSTTVYSEEVCLEELIRLTNRVVETMKKTGKFGRVVMIKYRTMDFETFTKRITLEKPTQSIEIIQREVEGLFYENVVVERGIRLIGMSVSSLSSNNAEPLELPLFQKKKTK